MRGIDKIVIHCSDTFAHMDVGADVIRDWHKQRGWADIGYHYVIRRDGTLEYGRDELVPGAHVAGHNQHSIAICIVGGKPDANFTMQQWKAMESLTHYLSKKYPNAKVVGHRDLDANKNCPCFDVKAWWNP